MAKRKGKLKIKNRAEGWQKSRAKGRSKLKPNFKALGRKR